MHRSRKLLGVRTSDWYQNKAVFLYFELVTLVFSDTNSLFRNFENGVPVCAKNQTFSVGHDGKCWIWIRNTNIIIIQKMYVKDMYKNCVWFKFEGFWSNNEESGLCTKYVLGVATLTEDRIFLCRIVMPLTHR